MGLFTKDIKTMEDLLLHTLQDIYYAEHQITASLPSQYAAAITAQFAGASNTGGAIPSASLPSFSSSEEASKSTHAIFAQRLDSLYRPMRH